MNRLQRTYQLEIATIDLGVKVFTLPFTIEINVNRSRFGSSNTATLRLYNLSPETREKIHKDRGRPDLIRAVKLSAGYDSKVSTVFEGSVIGCFSYRQGVDFITQIECFDTGNAFSNGQTNLQFGAGVSQRAVITSIIDSLGPLGIKKGAIGEYPGVLKRGNSYSGATYDILNQLTSGGFFVDNGTAHALGDTEVILGPIDQISPESGLIGTPKKEEFFITLDMLFEPTIILGQRILLKSFSEKRFNGSFQVVSVFHNGMISDAVCGNLITKLELSYESGSTVVPVGSE